MANEGWIKLHRKILDWEWYQNPNVLVVFVHCLLRANHTDKKWQGILIKRGSFITSYQTLSDELSNRYNKLSIQQVRTAVSKLKSTGEITTKANNKYTVITVVNYDQYQEYNKQANDQITNKQQTNNKQITTTKNDKNDKKVSKDRSGTPAYGNNEVNRFIDGVNKYLDLKLPNDGEARRYAHVCIKLLTKRNKKGDVKAEREFLDDDKWVNAKNFLTDYLDVKVDKGYNPQSWKTVHRNLKLWIANNGRLATDK